MGLGEGIRECVADVGVQTVDINSSAVTNAKLNASVATFYRGTLAGQASGYVTLVTVTTAATFFFGIVQVTAVGTSGTCTICNSAGTALVEAINCSAAAATYGNMATAVSTARVLEICAGSTLCALYTTAATTGFAAKYFVGCISTP